MDSKLNADPRLHHCCQNIVAGSLETAIDMFKILDCQVVYRPPAGPHKWAMVGQKQLRFALQLTEVSDTPTEDVNQKKQVHIAFISNDPEALIEKVQSWAAEKNIKFREGGWSKIERYFDLPDIFVNFIVEIMHTSIEKEDTTRGSLVRTRDLF